MLNPWLILGPSGMIIIGICAILFWRRKGKVNGTGEGKIPFRFFVLGGILWTAAIIPKLVMDYAITQPLYLWWFSSVGPLGGLILLGIYVGLRTGVFECGAAYLGFRVMEKREISGGGSAGSPGIGYNEAIAVGVGFGASEAIVLGLPSLLQMVAIFLNPSVLSGLSPDQLAIIESQLSQPTWAAVAAVWERAFVILVHVFATALAYAAVVQRRLLLLGYAIAYKSALDAPIPLLQAALAGSAYYIVITEAFVAIMGLIGLLGILNMDRIASTSANDNSSSQQL